jgi:hypothetical protein
VIPGGTKRWYTYASVWWWLVECTVQASQASLQHLFKDLSLALWVQCSQWGPEQAYWHAIVFCYTPFVYWFFAQSRETSINSLPIVCVLFRDGKRNFLPNILSGLWAAGISQTLLLPACGNMYYLRPWPTTHHQP